MFLYWSGKGEFYPDSQWVPVDCLRAIYSRLTRIKLAKGKVFQAIKYLGMLEAIAEDNDYRYLTLSVLFERVRLALKADDDLTLERILKEQRCCENSNQPSHLDYRYDRELEMELLIDSYLQMYKGQFTRALVLVDRLIKRASGANYIARLMSLLSLKAGCLWKNGHKGEAFEIFGEAYYCAHSHGLLRSLIDFNPYLELLLAGDLKKSLSTSPDYDETYFRRLACAVNGGDSQLALGVENDELSFYPLAPLTEREMDILRCVSGGESNQEISEALSISKNTVKWHIKNIFSKLDASHRAQAVARARKSKLII